jgi:voltage-gated potassium channel
MRKLIYEFGMSILAVIAVGLALIDINSSLDTYQQWLDDGIYVIFLVDYFTRLILAKNKKQFIKSNVLDLIAIIPFSSAFRIFRITKLSKLTQLAKLSKILKLTRLFAYIARMTKKCSGLLNTNGFKYMIIVTVSLILSGAFSMTIVENMSFSDALWWAFVTTSTVGYGDLSPSTDIGRCIAVVLMLTGIGLIGSLTSAITSFFIDIRKTSVKDDMLAIIKAKIDDVSELSDQDIDDICNILKSLNKTREHK